MTDAGLKDLDQELFLELTEPLAQPLLVHMVPPLANGNYSKFCLQINGNILKEPERDRRRKSYVFISKENQASALKEGRIFFNTV